MTALHPANRVVAFDFDGVLVRGDSFARLVVDLLRRSPWRLAIALPGALLLAPVVPRRWRRRMLRGLVHLALRGLDDAGYERAVAVHVARRVQQKDPFLGDGLAALRAHRAAGARVLVVTGCERRLASALLHHAGVDGIEVLGSTLEPSARGLRIGRHVVGHEKVAALADAGCADWDIAYDDSMLDVAMLARAARPVLVNASPALRARVEAELGRVVDCVRWR